MPHSPAAAATAAVAAVHRAGDSIIGFRSNSRCSYRAASHKEAGRKRVAMK